MMDRSIKEANDPMIVEAIRMYRETGDGTYVFDYALEEIGLRFGLDETATRQVLGALVDDKLVDPKLLGRVVRIVFGVDIDDPDDSPARQECRRVLDDRKRQRKRDAQRHDRFR